jgi:hypothetical protein
MALARVHVMYRSMTISFACESRDERASIASTLSILEPSIVSPYTQSIMSTKAATKKIVVAGGNGFLGIYTTNPLDLTQANISIQVAASAKQQPHEAGK